MSSPRDALSAISSAVGGFLSVFGIAFLFLFGRLPGRDYVISSTGAAESSPQARFAITADHNAAKRHRHGGLPGAINKQAPILVRAADLRSARPAAHYPDLQVMHPLPIASHFQKSNSFPSHHFPQFRFQTATPPRAISQGGGSSPCRTPRRPQPVAENKNT